MAAVVVLSLMENMRSFSLKNKIILVTGASSGIGRQTAVSVSQAGGKVVLTGRNRDNLKTTLGQMENEEHFLIPADLTDEKKLNSLADEVPGLDGVVHCAGIIKPFPVKFISEKQIDEVIKINFTAPVVLMSRLFKRKKINKKASIVFISSVSSQFPYVGGAVYTSSKAALNSYCKGIALEFAYMGIRSNCILPAMVKTPMFDQFDKEDMEKHRKQYLLGFGEPEDVANAVVFFLSDASKWITGTELILDGGLLINDKR